MDATNQDADGPLINLWAMPYAADLFVVFQKDEYLLCVTELKAPRTPQCVLSDPVVCSLSGNYSEKHTPLIRHTDGERERHSGRNSDLYKTNATIQSESCTQPLTVDTQSRHHQ